MSTKRIITIAVDETSEIPDHQVADLIHRLIPGSHGLSNHELAADFTDFEWDDNGDEYRLPMDEDQAQALMIDSEYLTIVVSVDQDEYLAAYADGLRGHDNDHLDFVHEQAFSFGLPHDCSVKILAADDDNFVVAYTTDIVESL